MPSKLTQTTRDDIQLQLKTGTRSDVIVNNYHINERQIYKMRKNLRIFGCIAPDSAQFQVQDRPRLITPEACKGMLNFLLKNGKLVYIDEIVFYLEEE